MTQGNETEEMILGLILYSPAMSDLIIPQAKAEYFTGKNRRLFEILAGMYTKRQGIEVFTVYPRIKNDPEWTVSALTKLTDQIIHTANAGQYIQDLKAIYVARELKTSFDIDIAEVVN